MTGDTRRSFFKKLLAGGVITGAAPWISAALPPPATTRPAHRRILGRTGADVSILSLGMASAFVRPLRGKPEERETLLRTALDHGVDCWDTARGYGPSEELIGPLVEEVRDRLFLVSKSTNRTYDGFLRDLETSLHHLRTDYLDIYHIHHIHRNDVFDEIETGAWRAARRMQDEKVIRFTGVTGHSGADLLIEAVRRWDPDTLLTIFPCTRPDHGRYEDELLPLARERDMGVFAMKLVRQARDVDLPGTDLIRYGLSLEGVHSAVVGQGDLALFREGAAMAADFTPLTPAEMSALTREAANALAGRIAPWDAPGYEDRVAVA